MVQIPFHGIPSLAYATSMACSSIFAFQIAGPVWCTDSPLISTATVTGISLTSNGRGQQFQAEAGLAILPQRPFDALRAQGVGQAYRIDDIPT